MKGQLDFLIEDFQLTLHPNEILMVKPAVPHAIMGGTGKIEHFGIRAPSPDDKQIVGELGKDVPLLYENERLVSGDWGHRIPLDMPGHKNCWLIGAGSAVYKSKHLILANLDFPTMEMANAGIGTRHQLHLHQKSWEYYVVLQGEKDILLVEDEHVAIHAGEILEVPPNVKHTLHSRQAPFLGFTLRFVSPPDQTPIHRGKDRSRRKLHRDSGSIWHREGIYHRRRQRTVYRRNR